MNRTYHNIINQQIQAFPPLSDTASRVLAITSDPESSAQDLMQVILPDQMMCSVILKVANSAFFGMPKEVASIERAIVVLGYEEIRNIVIGKAIFGSLPKLPRETREVIGLFWDHAYTCGLAAKIIGEHLRIAPGELFIAGLIHDVGKIAMLLTFPSEYNLLRDEAGECHWSDTKEEKTRFDVSHDEVGLRLARKWLLPEQLVMAIGCHHAPQDATEFIQYPLIVQLADIMSHLCRDKDRDEVEKFDSIINDLQTEVAPLWQQHNLPLNPDNFRLWFTALEEQHDNDQGLHSLFTPK